MFTCFVDGNTITDPEQMKPFGRCQKCLDAIAEQEAEERLVINLVRNYWLNRSHDKSVVRSIYTWIE